MTPPAAADDVRPPLQRRRRDPAAEANRPAVTFTLTPRLRQPLECVKVEISSFGFMKPYGVYKVRQLKNWFPDGQYTDNDVQTAARMRGISADLYLPVMQFHDPQGRNDHIGRHFAIMQGIIQRVSEFTAVARTVQNFMGRFLEGPAGGVTQATGGVTPATGGVTPAIGGATPETGGVTPARPMHLPGWCRSGKRRSVAVSEMLAFILGNLGADVTVAHRVQWYWRGSPCSICEECGSCITEPRLARLRTAEQLWLSARRSS